MFQRPPMQMRPPIQPGTGFGAMPGQPEPIPFTGYDQYRMGPRDYLLTRFNQLLQLHSNRITMTNQMLALWASVSHYMYGGTPASDQEERLRSSKAWKIVETMLALLWSKNPTVSVVPLQGSLAGAMESTDIAKSIAVFFDQNNLWDAFINAGFWSITSGVGPVYYYFDPFAMPDECPIVVTEVDPRTTVWKESIRHDGTVEFAYIAREEMAYEIFRKWNVASLGDSSLDQRAMIDPNFRLKVYDYWSEERMIDPETGLPQRYVVNAVFTEHGKWLRMPEIMLGYKHVPLHIFKGANFPVQETDPHLAHASALYSVEDEIKAEAHLASYLLMNAKNQVSPTRNLTSTRRDAAQRVAQKRGGVNRLYPDEKLEPENKGAGVTMDVQWIQKYLSDNIQSGTLPESFQGLSQDATAGGMSGISLSMASTGPLARIQRRQQFFENGLQKIIPDIMNCVGRHLWSAGRSLYINGPDPNDRQRFFTTTIDPFLLAASDIRVVIKLSSSLPRDAINEAVVTQGLVREGLLSRYSGVRHILSLIDIGVTDPAEEIRRIQEEQAYMQQVQMDQQMQQSALMGQAAQAAVPSGDGPRNGLLRSPLNETAAQQTGATQYGREVADVAMRGQGPVSNPIQASTSDYITRVGGLANPVQPLRGQ